MYCFAQLDGAVCKTEKYWGKTSHTLYCSVHSLTLPSAKLASERLRPLHIKKGCRPQQAKHEVLINIPTSTMFNQLAKLEVIMTQDFQYYSAFFFQRE